MYIYEYYEKITGIKPVELVDLSSKVPAFPEELRESAQEEIEENLFRFYQNERIASAHRKEYNEKHNLSYKSRA